MKSKLFFQIALESYASENVFNPWRDRDPLDMAWYGPESRRGRLQQHFDCEPRLLLVGEAPGYQGCHFSGVPFTNEALICRGEIPRIVNYGRFTMRAQPWREPSATIVWSALHAMGLAEDTVMWNAFPWHPHRLGEPHSNRTPTRAEVDAGLDMLQQVLAMFPGALVAPVGRVAERALARVGARAEPVLRHPSMGGATKFRAGLEELATRLQPARECA